jgi:hypothetical protein
MATTSWNDALDAIEERLQLARALLELTGDASALAVFEPPDVATPLPENLAPRARALHAEGEELQRRMAEEAAKIREELKRLPRMPAAERQPSKLDIQA